MSKLKITKKQKHDLVMGYDVPGFEIIDEQDLFMDSHGCNVVLVVVKKDGDDCPLGFTYRYSSEESFYDEDPMELVPLETREVVKVEYPRADGKDWGDCV